jgi:putative phosphoesterase
MNPTIVGKSVLISNENTTTVAVLSDTHGHLPAVLLDAVSGVDAIIHAGDMDTADVLTRLRTIAPVYAVRGNMDRGPWTRQLSPSAAVTIGQIKLFVLHIIENLDFDPAAAGFQAVISGHTHRAEARQANGLLMLNPGSPVLPRYGNSPSIALLRIQGPHLSHCFVEVAGS